MARTKISEFSATPADNTDIDNINIAEGCAPSGINNAIRELMSQLKDFQAGSAGDPFNGAVNGTLGATTPAAATITNLAYTGTLTGGTGVINIGSGQVYKDASGNVGIGTASPNNKLHISGAVAVAGAVNSFNVDGLVLDYGLGVSRLVAARTGGNYSEMSFYTAGANSSGVVAERMRLDSSGNVGIGGTPNGSYKLQVTNGSVYVGVNSDATNGVVESNGALFVRTNTANPLIFGTGSGGTERMRITSSGNLGVGTTSPSSRLGVVSDAGTKQIIWSDAANGTAYMDTASGASRIYSNVALAFGTGSDTFSEKARIDSSGNLLVGSTSALSRFVVQGASGQSGSYITSSAVNQDCFTFNCTGTSASVYGIGLYSAASAANTAYLFRGYNSSTTFCFGIAGNGNVTNTNNSYGAISDAKLKENIIDATPKLEKLNQVRVVNYNIIGDSQKQIGVIAQELEQIFPGMVDETPDRDAEGNDLGTTTKSVKYSVFVPMLIKAIQELKAEFDAYKAAHP